MGYSESDPVEGSVTFSGVWVHDPLDPEGTIRQYPYGNTAGGLAVAVQQESRHYAGRKFPVTDYGEFQDDVMSVGVNVIRSDPYFPNGGDLGSLYGFATLRRSVTVRDGDSRIATGPMESWAESRLAGDITQVSFSVRQTHPAEVVI